MYVCTCVCVRACVCVCVCVCMCVHPCTYIRHMCKVMVCGNQVNVGTTNKHTVPFCVWKVTGSLSLLGPMSFTAKRVKV